ncbi:MAG: SRPBCC family protein [Candidatus Obscuribacterales bacterium]|nr:SRPBCC family protein [Candidatus Obscuribacterales bacterium]
MKKILHIFVISSLLLAATSLPSSARDSKAKNTGKSAGVSDPDRDLNRELNKVEARDNSQWASGSIVIKAPPEVVWQAVHDERNSDPDLAYSKILEQGENECKLEQKFTFIPVIGTAVCQMYNHEVPNERIDYKLIKSDRFKAMEGSWVLTAMEEGKTRLDLSTNLDMGIPVPRGMVNAITAKKLATRLKHVKEMAETRHAKLAQNKKITH